MQVVAWPERDLRLIAKKKRPQSGGDVDSVCEDWPDVGRATAVELEARCLALFTARVLVPAWAVVDGTWVPHLDVV